MTRKTTRTCPFCEATCGLLLTFDDDERLVEVRGDPDDVLSRGHLCPKGAAIGALHDDPDRLRRPQVRRDGVLREASWAEAFAAVEAGLMPIVKAHGRQAVGVYLGNPNVHTLAGQLTLKTLLQALRTKSLYTASTLDQMPKHVASGLLFGSPDAIAVPDLDRCDYLMILGANPVVSNGSLCTAPGFEGRLKALRSRGGRLVVVDPRRTRTADLADEHIAILPGGDAWLLFAVVHTLFAEGLVELGALAPHVEGLDDLRALAAELSPERVSEACGVPAETIVRLARELAAAPSAALYGRIGTCTQPFGTLTSWLVDVIHILTGNLDRPGGAMFPRPFFEPHRPDRVPGGRGFVLGRYRSRVKGYPEVRRELPTATLPDEILTPGEGQLRALITVAGNPALSAPGGDRMGEALGALEFMVSVDPYLNETTRHADVVLPPPSPLERPHADLALMSLAVRNTVRYSPAALPLPEGALSEDEILLRLTMIAAKKGAGGDPQRIDELTIKAMAQSELRAPDSPLHGLTLDEVLSALAPRTRAERLLDFLLRAGPYGDHFGRRPEGLTLDRLRRSPHGVDLGPLEPRLPGLLQTRSAKIELVCEPITQERARLVDALSEPRAEGLLLIGRRQLRSNNSWMHNLPRLVRGRSSCTLQIHPEDAAQLGLRDGELALIESRVGRITAPIEVNERVRSGVVSLPHGWGHGAAGSKMAVAADHAGVNINALTDPERLDPLSGDAVFNGVPVTVSGARQGEAG